MALPSTPTNPTPGDGNTADASARTLTWTAVGATACRVYLTAMPEGARRLPTTEVPGLLLPGITMSGTGTDLGGGAFAFNHNTGDPELQTLPVLGYPITYAWQVIAVNATGETSGPLWTFTTVVPGEDFVTVLTSTTTGTINDFNAGSFSASSVLRMNNASLTTITGLTNNGATPTDGTMVWIESVGAGQVDIANQDVGSTATNRVITGVTGTISLAAGVGRALLSYDNATGRWRVLEHEQGAWISVTFNAADFTATGGAGAWTVASVNRFRYWLKGRTLTFVLQLSGSSVTATTVTLNVKIPGGFSAVGTTEYFPAGDASDNGTSTGCYGGINSGSLAKVDYRRLDGTGWAVSVTNTSLFATVTFEVQ